MLAFDAGVSATLRRKVSDKISKSLIRVNLKKRKSFRKQQKPYKYQSLLLKTSLYGSTVRAVQSPSPEKYENLILWWLKIAPLIWSNTSAFAVFLCQSEKSTSIQSACCARKSPPTFASSSSLCLFSATESPCNAMRICSFSCGDNSDLSSTNSGRRKMPPPFPCVV